MKRFASLKTFAEPIQAEHPTQAISQVNIVGENLKGRCAFLCFPLDQLQWLMTIESWARISTELRCNYGCKPKWRRKTETCNPDRQIQDSGATSFVQHEIDFQGVSGVNSVKYTHHTFQTSCAYSESWNKWWSDTLLKNIIDQRCLKKKPVTYPVNEKLPHFFLFVTVKLNEWKEVFFH